MEKKSQVKVKWKIAYIHVSHGLEHLLFWVRQKEKRRRRMEEEKNPFGKVDADRWDWRQAGQSAPEEQCARLSVNICDVSVCLCACLRAQRVPDYFSWLIPPSIRLTCMTFQSSAAVGGGEEKATGRNGEERKNKNQCAESITRNSSGRQAQIVKGVLISLYLSLMQTEAQNHIKGRSWSLSPVC